MKLTERATDEVSATQPGISFLLDFRGNEPMILRSINDQTE